jgi:hypothetical protein
VIQGSFSPLILGRFLFEYAWRALWIISSYFSSHNSKGKDDCGRDTRERKLGWTEGNDEGSYEILAKAKEEVSP